MQAASIPSLRHAGRSKRDVAFVGRPAAKIKGHWATIVPDLAGHLFGMMRNRERLLLPAARPHNK